MKLLNRTGLVFLLWMVSFALAYEYPSFYREATGNMLYTEHFTGAWCGGIEDGVDGPSYQIIHGRRYVASDCYGNYYFFDMLNQQIWWRDTNGIVKVIAGTGQRGFEDGPGAQAMFFASPTGGGYDALNCIKCDDSGRVYVSDNNNNRLRMIHRKADGEWWVSTVCGGGTITPATGKWVNALTAKFGCSPQFGILPDGSAAYYANYGGIWKVQIDHQNPELSMVTILRTGPEMKVDIPGLGNTPYEWKSGTLVTPDSQLFWSPYDPSAFLKYSEKTNVAELWAGSLTHGSAQDNGGWRQDARWHTHQWVGSISGKVIFTGGGDEGTTIRRIYQDTVKHLLATGAYAIMNGEAGCYAGNPLCVDHKGGLVYVQGNHDYGLLVERMTFENTDTSSIWSTLATAHEKVSNKDEEPGSLYAFPNPFNPTTVLHYNLGSYASLKRVPSLTIFDGLGRMVRELNINSKEGDAIWLGNNSVGQRVAAGHYFAVLKCGSLKIEKQLLLIK